MRPPTATRWVTTSVASAAARSASAWTHTREARCRKDRCTSLRSPPSTVPDQGPVRRAADGGCSAADGRCLVARAVLVTQEELDTPGIPGLDTQEVPAPDTRGPALVTQAELDTREVPAPDTRGQAPGTRGQAPGTQAELDTREARALGILDPALAIQEELATLAAQDPATLAALALDIPDLALAIQEKLAIQAAQDLATPEELDTQAALDLAIQGALFTLTIVDGLVRTAAECGFVQAREAAARGSSWVAAGLHWVPGLRWAVTRPAFRSGAG